MATTTIGTTGRDYSTAAAWADAAAADLTGTGDYIGECYNDGTITETALVSLNSTQTASDRMILRCATGQSFKDHANKLTNPLRPDQTKGVLLNITTHTSEAFQVVTYAVIQNIQITDTRGYGILSGFNTNDQSLMGKMVGVLARGSAGASGLPFVSTIRCNIINSALIVTNNARGIWDQGTGGPGRVSHCTIVNVSGTSSAKGLEVGADVFGTAVFNFGADNTVGGSSSNNATDRASFGGGSANQTSLTTTNEIESATSGSEDLRAKSTGNLDLNGVRDQTYTNDLDIVGQTRSTSTPTIGAWEVVAGGAVAEGGGMLLGSRRNRLTIP